MSSVKDFLEDGTKQSKNLNGDQKPTGRQGQGEDTVKIKVSTQGVKSKKLQIHKELVIIWHYWSVK